MRKCDYETSSKTLLIRHTKVNHEDKGKVIEHQDNNIDTAKMRKRFSCELCTFKTTNENFLIVHRENNHPQEDISEKSSSKRIHCKKCGKKFNKKETFNKHLKSCQKSTKTTVTQDKIGRSNQINEAENNSQEIQIQENEEQSREYTGKRKREP